MRISQCTLDYQPLTVRLASVSIGRITGIIERERMGASRIDLAVSCDTGRQHIAYELVGVIRWNKK